jgi:hypothetical protein
VLRKTAHVSAPQTRYNVVAGLIGGSVPVVLGRMHHRSLAIAPVF